MQIQAHFQPLTFIRIRGWWLILALITGTGCEGFPMEDATSPVTIARQQVTESGQVVADFREVDVQAEMPSRTEGLGQWQPLLQDIGLEQYTVVGQLSGPITRPDASQTLLFLRHPTMTSIRPRAADVVLVVLEDGAFKFGAYLLPDQGVQPIGAIRGAGGLLLPVMRTDFFHMGVSSSNLIILTLRESERATPIQVVERFQDAFHHSCGLSHLPQEIAAQRILADVASDDDNLRFSIQSFLADCSSLDTLISEDFIPAEGLIKDRVTKSENPVDVAESVPPFDAQLWRQGSSGDLESLKNRLAMVPALRSQHLRQGISRSLVHRLLGSPDFQRDRLDYYDLGPGPYRIDHSSLVIEYDDQSKLVVTRVQEH